MSLKRTPRIVFLCLAALLGVTFIAGCGGSKNAKPGETGSEQEGTISGLSKEKPSVYEVKPGDTLPKIAAKPEVYGDAKLWPLLLNNNNDIISKGRRLKPGTKLLIRRDLSDEEVRAARAEAVEALAKPKPKPAAAKAPAAKPAAPAAKQAAKPVAKPAPTVAATPAPPPAPVKKSGMGWSILLIFIFLLLVAAVVMLYLNRRENKA